MTDETMKRRRAAARAGFTGAAAEAIAALEDSEPSVRIAGLRSLNRLDELTSTRIETALADPAPQVRITALEIAALRPEPDVTRLLADPDPAVVEMAAWVCGERTDAPQPPIVALSELAVAHEDPLVREAAVAALGALGDEAGLPAILQATTDKPAVRRRAVLCLAAFEGPEVDAAWERARTDHDRQVRDAVEELLGPSD